MNLNSKDYAPSALKAVALAVNLAISQNYRNATAVDLLWALSICKGTVAYKILLDSDFNISPTNLKAKVITKLLPNPLEHPALMNLEALFIGAEAFSKSLAEPLISTEAILWCTVKCLEKQDQIFLKKHKVNLKYLNSVITDYPLHAMASQSLQSPLNPNKKTHQKTTHKPHLPNPHRSGEDPNSIFCEDCQDFHSLPLGLHEDPDKRTLLERYTRDLTALATAKKLDPVSGREKEITRLLEILGRRTKNNPLLLGEAGVGKTALVEGLAQYLVEVPKKTTNQSIPLSPFIKNARLLALDLTSLTAGTIYRGDLEARLEGILAEIKSAGNIILFIDEVHLISTVGAGSNGIDIANLLKPPLARSELHCIGATTFSEYKRYIEGDAALARRFVTIRVAEPSEAETEKILASLSSTFGNHHGIKYSGDLLKKMVELTARFLPQAAFPDKAIDLLDEVGSASFQGSVNLDDLYLATAKLAGIPVQNITGINKALLNLEATLGAEIFGQNNAISKLGKALRRGFLKLHGHNKPVSSLLFTGPTGVGKTATAKLLAKILYGDSKALHRFDMSDYSESHTVSKLIGSPPGYVGYKEQARLTDLIKAKPHCVIVCDEFDRAHPTVRQLFAQIIEEGELTDALGKTVSFKECVVIFTTNIGGDVWASGETGFTTSKPNQGTLNEPIQTKLNNLFKAEFINRIDAVIPFISLTNSALVMIVDKELASVASELNKRGIAFHYESGTSALIANQVKLKHGARDAKRLINQGVIDPIADLILTSNPKKIFCHTKGSTIGVRS